MDGAPLFPHLASKHHALSPTRCPKILLFIGGARSAISFYVPDPCTLPRHEPHRRPVIVEPEQIARMLRAVETIWPPCRDRHYDPQYIGWQLYFV